MNNWLRVDTHVHLHECFDDAAFLDAAADNMQVANTRSFASSALCFTEVHGVDRFSEWAKFGEMKKLGKSQWTIATTEESNSLVATDSRGRKLAVIAGRQIECREGIEVLAIGQVSDPPDGEPVRDVLAQVAADGAMPVLPWGFLKWSGRRGKIIDALLKEAPSGIALGDNGARLAGTNEPKQFRLARKRGFPILPGTDPFPFRWDADRVGSFGLHCCGHLSLDTPFVDLKMIIQAPDPEIGAFGHRLGLLAFLRNQFAIQIRKRLGLNI